MGFLVSAEVEDEYGFSVVTVMPSTVKLRLCFCFLATTVCQRASHNTPRALLVAVMRPAPLFTLNTTCESENNTNTSQTPAVVCRNTAGTGAAQTCPLMSSRPIASTLRLLIPSRTPSWDDERKSKVTVTSEPTLYPSFTVTTHTHNISSNSSYSSVCVSQGVCVNAHWKRRVLSRWRTSPPERCWSMNPSDEKTPDCWDSSRRC